ncbi:hypothetical protein AX769_10565 [Frondihabitans sp. PAMC 28766]|uniref:hypothetical protein n=1 Tax=Frondihabitans sp. PAMC 28766 TaxID=1795630 RepID=UPI00078BB034|nr:hypothetical protein [Frondihabitans sp. PAMC 28766]AMM20509.1 hypothetical protein AX769_10565 [Frondihabitans sp. PAMC 28766]
MDNTSRPEFRGAGRSLEVLRAEAHDELRTLIELRCRAGEDPWDVIPELPTVDEHVVISLRADSFGHAAAGSSSGLGLDDELEFLRGIALWHPELSRAVWSLMGRLEDVGRRP